MSDLHFSDPVPVSYLPFGYMMQTHTCKGSRVHFMTFRIMLAPSSMEYGYVLEFSYFYPKEFNPVNQTLLKSFTSAHQKELRVSLPRYLARLAPCLTYLLPR